MVRGCEAIDQAIDIERALAALTAKQREAVTLAMQGYTQAEIARGLGVHRNAIRRRILRAKVCINGFTSHLYE